MTATTNCNSSEFELQNINGLLNMVAWARLLGGHLIPHGQMPEDFGRGNVPSLIMIEQNALRRVRHEVMVQWNPHVTQDVHGQWIKVRRDEKALFEEDRNQPYYATEEWNEGGWPACVYEFPLRPWWCALEAPENTSAQWAYERSKMIKTWVSRAVPALEAALPGLPKGPVRLWAKFEGEVGKLTDNGKFDLLTADQAKAAITASADDKTATVTVIVGPRFEQAIFHPDNIAERALVAGIVEGFAALARHPLSLVERNALIDAIVPNTSARQSHAFRERQFRDFVRSSVPHPPVTIDREDFAIIKLGLGWRVRSRSDRRDVQGKMECLTFLNAVVRLLEDELCAELRQFDREAVIDFALANHESAINDRDNWARTAAAVLALHNDREATLRTMAEHVGRLNAVLRDTRLLVEFAICESPLRAVRKPGHLDLSRLMAQISMIAGLGGWSDTIRWDAEEPFIRVTPLGDIHAKHSFQGEIFAPYGRAGIDLRIQESVKNYAKNLEEPEVGGTDDGRIAAEFWEAFEKEFGASIEVARKFIDSVEDLGIKAGKAILKVPKSVLLNAKIDGETIDPEAVTALVERLTFKSRACWRDVPEGYDEKDRQPWQFRRQLSVLHRPLIQIDDTDDPTMLIAPGIVRDAVLYMIGNYYHGDFPLAHLTQKMKRWAGKSRDRIGKEFTQAVAKRLEEHGWKTETEIKVTKLLRKGFEKDYGDVDVLARRSDE